eukprot:SAG11_NODE_5807_length_1459_cov_1.858824_3_plen_45_part_01
MNAGSQTPDRITDTRPDHRHQTPILGMRNPVARLEGQNEHDKATH